MNQDAMLSLQWMELQKIKLVIKMANQSQIKPSDIVFKNKMKIVSIIFLIDYIVFQLYIANASYSILVGNLL